MTKLHQVLEDHGNFYIICELMLGGSLQERLKKDVKPSGYRYNEKLAAKIINQVLKGINCLHS